MIDKQTVFILGAGASVPYGYPTGTQLRQQIIENLDLNRLKTDILQFNVLLRRMLLQEKMDEAKELKDNLLEARRSSIDLFLEKRPKLMNIGKLAIACGIIEFEKADKGAWDWFEHLHDSELAQSNSAEDYCQDNNMNFITFNYDRHLEHALISSLKSTYDEDEETCAELIKENFEIIHVHGKLDSLPWEDKNGRAYGKKPSTLEELSKSAAGIKIIHEKRNEKESFGNAIKLIEDAELIIFLGLNLHNETNLNRLDIKNNIEGKRIYATFKGLTRPQRNDVSEYFNHKLYLLSSRNIEVNRPEVFDYGAFEMLREEVRFRF